jgi:hypothetical protein
LPRPSESWGSLDLSGQPLLVLGWRPRPKRLEARVVDAQRNAHGVLRDIATAAVEDLTDRDPVPWTADAHVEQGEEYLVIETAGQLPAGTGTEPDPDLADASALLRLVLNPSDLDDLDLQHYDGAPFAFYAIVFEKADAGAPAAFIRAWDPTQLLRRASRWFRFENSLSLADPPDLALDDRVDLVATRSEVAVLRSVAFERLFADVRSALDDVPSVVGAIGSQFVQLPLTSASADAISTFCATRPSFAKRLRRLAQASHLPALDEVTFTSVLKQHGETPTDFIQNGEICIDEHQVRGFLDVLEGRWFTADFTSERRRADRFRPR